MEDHKHDRYNKETRNLEQCESEKKYRKAKLQMQFVFF